MKFIIVVERALSSLRAIGPFDHEEDARAYAHEKHGHEVTIWRIAQLEPPEDVS